MSQRDDEIFDETEADDIEELTDAMLDDLKAVLAKYAAGPLWFRQDDFTTITERVLDCLSSLTFAEALKISGRKPFDPWAVADAFAVPASVSASDILGPLNAEEWVNGPPRKRYDAGAPIDRIRTTIGERGETK